MKQQLLATVIASGFLFISCVTGTAGVVFTIEVTANGQSETSLMRAQGDLLAMEMEGDGPSGEMIFRGDRGEMIAVQHDDESYMVIDEATIQQLSEQMSAAMAQMEQAMANMPEAARQRLRAMQQSGNMPGMPGMMGGGDNQPSLKIRKTDRTESMHGYACRAIEMVRDGRVVRELWVTDWDEVEGGEEMAGAFKGMAEFASQMIEAFRGPMGRQFPGAMVDEAFAAMKSIDGCPVVTREFDSNGQLERESVLRSAELHTLEPSEFEPPEDYRRQNINLPGGR